MSQNIIRLIIKIFNKCYEPYTKQQIKIFTCFVLVAGTLLWKVNMVSGVTQKPISTSIFYINDIHGRTSNMERITSASKDFDTFTPQSKDKLKLSSGDVMLGQNEKTNRAAHKFLTANNIMASAVGNHEFDQKSKPLLNIIKNSPVKFMGFNTDCQKDGGFDTTLVKSYIQEENGNKYGIIGLMPFDLLMRVKSKPEGFEIVDKEKTYKDLQKEIDNMKEQGVNKIILLSHTGYEAEVEIAKNVEGIDVILGGHSHDLIKGIEEGKNLFYSKKTGEPTIITQAGRDGNNFGILNLEFDKDGVIISAQNNVGQTKDFPKNMALQKSFDKILGEAKKVGYITSAAPMPENTLLCENPHADFIADAIRSELNVDIAMINSANLRGCFEAGDMTTRDMAGITPFKNEMTIIKLNEKEIVDCLKYTSKSITKSNGKPGLMQVSGLNYTINKQGELLDLNYVGKDGSVNKIDINNPNIFKTYSVGIDDFCSRGREGYTMLNKYDEPDTVKLGYDKDKLTIDYIQKQTQPINIEADGRIKIVD